MKNREMVAPICESKPNRKSISGSAGRNFDQSQTDFATFLMLWTLRTSRFRIFFAPPVLSQSPIHFPDDCSAAGRNATRNALENSRATTSALGSSRTLLRDSNMKRRTFLLSFLRRTARSCAEQELTGDAAGTVTDKGTFHRYWMKDQRRSGSSLRP